MLCINLCRVVDPHTIVFGGGMARAGDTLLDLVRKYMREKTWTVLPTDVVLATAKSIVSGGMLGAALAAKKVVERGGAAVSVGVAESTSSVVIETVGKGKSVVSSGGVDVWTVALSAAGALVVGLGLGLLFSGGSSSRNSNK